jgi:hypothetical protein
MAALWAVLVVSLALSGVWGSAFTAVLVVVAWEVFVWAAIRLDQVQERLFALRTATSLLKQFKVLLKSQYICQNINTKINTQWRNRQRIHEILIKREEKRRRKFDEKCLKNTKVFF